MKQIFHKIMSSVMAFVVLFSTMSFTIDMHFCGDTLIDTAIFHKTETCGMEMEASVPTSENKVSKKNCCSDKQIVVDGQDELKTSFEKLTIDQQVFIASFIYAYNNLFESVEENIKSYGDSSPSLVVKDIYKLDETYLI